MYRYYPRKQPFYMFFVSPRSDTLFVMLSLAELSWFPYRIMTLWTSLSAFIYVLLLPSCLYDCEWQGRGKVQLTATRSIPPGFQYRLYFPTHPVTQQQFQEAAAFIQQISYTHLPSKPQSFPLYLRCASLCVAARLSWLLLQAELCSSSGYPWCY